MESKGAELIKTESRMVRVGGVENGRNLVQCTNLESENVSHSVMCESL